MNSDFLFTDDFISKAKNNFDIILFEHTFNSENQNFLGAIAHNIRQEQKILIVVSKTSVDAIFPIIQRGVATTTIINPSCGLTGFANKGFWDIQDIAKAKSFGLEVYETIYQEQILDFLDSTKTSCYIRTNEHVSWKDQLPYIDNKDGFISFQNQNHSGSNGTILCFGTILIDCLYGSGILQEKGKAMDVFTTSDLYFNMQKDFKESLQRTEKLVIIIDQHLGSLYESRLKSLIYESGLTGISIRFITPSYQSISSFSLEYIYEQARIDGFGISERIMG